MDAERQRLGARRRSRVEHSGRHHVVDHAVPPLARPARIAEGRAGIGRGDDAGQERGLAEAQRIDRLVEVPTRRLGDARDAAAFAASPIHHVEIHLEDLVLGQQELEPDREEHLAHLAIPGALRPEEEAARELLRDRARALAHAAGLEVDDQRAQVGAQVEAPVVVETAILGRDDRLAHHLGDARQRHPRAADPRIVHEQRGDDRLEARRARPIGRSVARASAETVDAHEHAVADLEQDALRAPVPRGIGHVAEAAQEDPDPVGSDRPRAGLAGLESHLAIAANGELTPQVFEGQRASFEERHARRVEPGREGPGRAGRAARAQGVETRGERDEQDDPGEREQRERAQHGPEPRMAQEGLAREAPAWRGEPHDLNRPGSPHPLPAAPRPWAARG